MFLGQKFRALNFLRLKCQHTQRLTRDGGADEKRYLYGENFG